MHVFTITIIDNQWYKDIVTGWPWLANAADWNRELKTLLQMIPHIMGLETKIRSLEYSEAELLWSAHWAPKPDIWIFI